MCPLFDSRLGLNQYSGLKRSSPIALIGPEEDPDIVGHVIASETSLFNGGSVTDGQAVSAISSYGNATHSWAQLNTSRQSTWYESGGINNGPRLSFAGNEAVSGTNSLTQGFSVIGVIIPTLDGLVRRWVCGSGTVANLNIEGAISQKNTLLRIDADGTELTTSPEVMTAGWLVYKAIFNGTSSKVGFNGSSWYTGDVGTGGMTNYGFGGYDSSGSFVLSSSIADFIELAIFDAVKTEAELDAYQEYFINKYS